jgi:hypothetical protein
MPKYAMKNCIYIFSFIAITLLAWHAQSLLYFSWDNSILLHETERLLAGGSYTHNFFETSPPMIFYLYLPVVLFTKMFSTSPTSLLISFRVYIFLLTFLCLWLYQSLAIHIFKKEDTLFRDLAFFSLMAIFLIFPMFELGQRDCLFMLLSLPYVTTAVLRIENIKINLFKAILIGFLAGLGVGIKPHFIFLPLLIELYVLFRSKNLLKCFSPETITLSLVLIVYTLIALYLHPDYFQVVIPYAMRLYYSGIGLSWSSVAFHPINIFASLALLLYLLEYKNLGTYKTFVSVFCLALISFMLAFTLQQVLFFYHGIPPLAFTLFLNILLMCIIFQQALTKKRCAILAILACINLAVLIYSQQLIWILLNSSLAILICILFLLLVLSLFAYYSRCTKTSLSLITAFMITSFTFPTSISYIMYAFNSNYAYRVSPILAYLKSQAKNHSVYLFSSCSSRLFPLVDYAQASSASRFPFFWMMPGLLNQTNLKTNAQLLQRIKDKNLLIDMVTEDLKTQKPDYVFVDVSKFKENIPSSFQILPYFLSSQNFQVEWKNYRFITKISENMNKNVRKNYQFDFAVYQRQEEKS